MALSDGVLTTPQRVPAVAQEKSPERQQLDNQLKEANPRWHRVVENQQSMLDGVGQQLEVHQGQYGRVMSQSTKDREVFRNVCGVLVDMNAEFRTGLLQAEKRETAARIEAEQLISRSCKLLARGKSLPTNAMTRILSFVR